MGVGVLEIVVVLFVVFLILGPKRLQNMVKAAGRGATDFIDNIGQGKGGREDRKLRSPRDDDDSEGR